MLEQEPQPLSDGDRRRFVRKNKRLHPTFFFAGGDGLPRPPLRHLLESLATAEIDPLNFMLAWTPHLVEIGIDPPAGLLRRYERWLGDNARDCWMLWFARIDGERKQVIGFRRKEDAALFRLFHL